VSHTYETEVLDNTVFPIDVSMDGPRRLDAEETDRPLPAGKHPGVQGLRAYLYEVRHVREATEWLLVNSDHL